jgi:hypothetical protein
VHIYIIQRVYKIMFQISGKNTYVHNYHDRCSYIVVPMCINSIADVHIFQYQYVYIYITTGMYKKSLRTREEIPEPATLAKSLKAERYCGSKRTAEALQSGLQNQRDMQ